MSPGFLSYLASRIELMFGRLKQAITTLEKVVGALDPDVLEPGFALDLVELFSKVERLGAAGKSLAAGRVAYCGRWRDEGDRSAAHFLARKTGESVGQVVGAISTARRMDDLPQASEAFRSGELSQAQAAEIAQAAILVPEAEKDLLEVARAEGITRLKQECQRVIAQACPDEQDKALRLHRSRYLRTYTDGEGAFRLDARLTPEAGAEVRVALDVLRDELFERARRHGQRESYQAIDADALVEMARASAGSNGIARGSKAPKALVNLRVDHAALKRGHTKKGEVCEIPGVGPISVESARALASDSILKVLLVKGTEVKAVANYGRTIPASTRAVLIETYPECVVIGCHETKGLEIDHVIPLPEGSTSPENLVRICAHHHRLKTYRRFRLGERKNGKAPLEPPNGARSRDGPRE